MSFLLTLLMCLLGIAPAWAGEFPEVENWQPSGEVELFGPEDLWKHINGAADQYLAFGFQLLQVCELTHGEQAVTVSLFDMGLPLHAFGIFRAEMSPEQETEPIGAAAYLALPYQAVLLKGPLYVKVETWKGDLTEEPARALLSALATALPGTAELPADLARLPVPGKVPGSERFTREGFLGLSDLANCVHADYTDSNGTDYQRFWMMVEPDHSLPETWATLVSRWKPLALEGAPTAKEEKKGKKVPEQEESGEPAPPVLVREVPYRGPVAIKLCDDGILGVTGPPEPSQLMALLGNCAPAP